MRQSWCLLCLQAWCQGMRHLCRLRRRAAVRARAMHLQRTLAEGDAGCSLQFDCRAQHRTHP